MKDKKKIQALISLLDDEDMEVYTQIEQEFIDLGEEIIPVLEKEWEKNFNPVVQHRIEEIIHLVQFNVLKDKLVLWYEGGGVDLLEGMCILAAYQYPDLEQQEIQMAIEDFYLEAQKAVKPGMVPYDHVKILNDLLFTKYKFSANTKNFHAPGNSMINVVLETKKGNPLTLSVIYMLVAQKLKLPVFGVNLPNLFVLTYKPKNEDEEPFYINAFNRGLVFSRADIDNYIAQLNLSESDIFYEPCSHIEILKRAMRNLIVSFEKLGDPDKVEEVKQLLLIITDEDSDKY